MLTDGTPDSDPDGNPLAVTGFTVAGVAGSFAPGASATIPGVGSLSIAANGAYTFAPASNYNGPVPVATYTISDGLGGSDSATLTFANVSAVNDAPLAVADTNSVPINTPISGNVITNDTDVEGNVLSVTEFTVTGVAGTFVAGTTATIPGVGTLVINANGTYTFNPAANYAGAIPVATYTITDGQGAPNTASATLTLTMGSNNPPVANDDGPVAVTEDTPVSGNVLTDGTPDSDPDGNPLAVTGFTVAGVAGSFAPGASATIPGVGSLSIAANGAYTFAPASNYNGPVPVATYTISDGPGGSTPPPSPLPSHQPMTISPMPTRSPAWQKTPSSMAVCSLAPPAWTAPSPSPLSRSQATPLSSMQVRAPPSPAWAHSALQPTATTSLRQWPTTTVQCRWPPTP